MWLLRRDVWRLQALCVYTLCVHAAPVVVSPPEHMKNLTGSNVAILCEAKGFPIPTIEWTWMRVDGQMVYLPSEWCALPRFSCVAFTAFVIELRNDSVAYYEYLTAGCKEFV